MKPRPPLTPGPYLVVGLARSGVAAALALRARGEEVIGCDAGAASDPALARSGGKAFARRASKFTWMRQATPLPPAPGRSSRAPAYPKTPPPCSRRGARHVPVLGELELAWRLLPNEFIAVTGTNGKTTTTEWIGHIHREAALPVAVAGNVGHRGCHRWSAALDPEATVVCEASSFQLEDTVAFAPEAAVLLNLVARPPRPPPDATRTTSPPS